jgi:hypothetical protein
MTITMNGRICNMMEKSIVHDRRSRPRYFGWVVVLILLGGFGLRIWRIGHTSMWLDEAAIAFRVRASLGQTLTYVSENASQGPFYYALLNVLPKKNELMFRFPSVLMAMIGMAVLIFAMVRFSKNYNVALLAGGLLAVNPYHVWLSRTATVYSLLFTLCLINSCFFLILLRGDRRRVNWLIYILSGMAAYVTHHFALALPLVQYIVFGFVLPAKRGFFRRWLRAQIVMGIPLTLWVIRLMRQEQVVVGAGWIPTPDLKDIGLTLWNMALGYDGTHPWYLILGLMAVAVGLVPGLCYAWKERKAERVNLYWFWLLVTTLGLAFVVSVTIRPFYVDRYFIVFLPALILLMINGWQHIPSRSVSLALAGVVLVTSLATVIITLHDGKDEREDWRAATAYIQQTALPGDGLLVEMPNKLFPLRYYWQGDLIDYAWLSAGIDEAGSLAEQYDQPVRRIWAVYRNPFDDGHRQGVMPDFDPFRPDAASPMPEWLAPRREQVQSVKAFKGVTVLLVDVQREFSAVGD